MNITVRNSDLLAQARQLIQKGDLPQAERLMRQRVEAAPTDIESLHLLATICLLKKNYAESQRLHEQVLAIQPAHVEAINNLGVILLEYHRNYDAAENCFRKVLELSPTHVNGLMNLGNVYQEQHHLDQAIDLYLRALAVDPGNSRVLNNLGAAYAGQEDRKEAARYYRLALEHDPDDSEILANLLASEKALGNKTTALELSRRVLGMENPGAAMFSAFSFFRMACLWNEATGLLPRVLDEIHAGRASWFASEEINMTLLATPEIDTATLFDIHKATGRVLDLRRLGPPFSGHNDASSAGRLRVGYLSPDFKNHVVNTFFRGLINHLDRDRFEVFCYSNLPVEDHITKQYRATADVFVNVSELTDRQLAERIFNDGIHFLVDLAGFTHKGRTGVLSYTPAPVQMMYLGYPYTSGLTAVDYFISDPYLDGPENAPYFTEKQLQLPQSFITCDELHEQVVSPLCPFEQNSFITFGSMNNAYKLNPEIIRVWSKILNMVPRSRIIINHPNLDLEVSRENIWDEFSRHGIGKERVDIVWAKNPEGSYLRYYNDFDIALDTFPQTGGTTTIDAVWMGVPVITLVGEIYPHRLSYSILKNVGTDIDDLVAFSDDEYIEKAVSLAQSPDRIRELRRIIPENLKSSIICDPVRLTRHMEAAYIEAWNRKFPDRPISLEPTTPRQFVKIRDEYEITISGGLDDLETYVLQEQQGWFEAEHNFAIDVVRAGQKVVDINAGKGIYALPMARKVGPDGELWAATQTPGDSRYLDASIKRNGFENLHLFVAGDRKLVLDHEMEIHELRDIDFVKIKLNVASKDILLSGKSFFEVNSPLVMFSVKQGDQGIDTTFAGIFREWGYSLYRLVPGLGILVPFAADSELDTFAMNLYCCKGDRAEHLMKRGLLARETSQISELPGIHDRAWQNYLGSFPYAADQLQFWPDSVKQHHEWESYWTALNLFVVAKDTARDSEQRYAALNTAYGILMLLVQTRATLPRCLTFCRVLSELGKRETAVNLLNEIVSFLESGAEVTFNEPFLALSDEYANMAPGDRIGEWLVASILEQREKLRAFSSFFTGLESLPILTAIKESGFCTTEVERRITLIEQRNNPDK